MRVRVACVAVLLACAAAASPALGALSLSGPTGLVALPSAEVVPAEMVGAAADITDSDFTGTTLPVRLAYGILTVAEIGGTYTYSEDGHTVGAHAKYLIPDRFDWVDLAVGGIFDRGTIDRKGARADLSFLQFYTAGTGRMPFQGPFGLAGTVGLNWTRYEFGDPYHTGVRLFAGIEASFGANWTAAAEYQTKDSGIDDDPVASLALRWTRGPWTVQAGVTNAWGMRGTADHNLFAGLQYEFGPL